MISDLWCHRWQLEVGSGKPGESRRGTWKASAWNGPREPWNGRADCRRNDSPHLRRRSPEGSRGQGGVTEHKGCRKTGCEPHRSHTAGTVGKELRMGPRARLQQEEHSDLLLELGLTEGVGFMSLVHGGQRLQGLKKS